MTVVSSAEYFLCKSKSKFDRLKRTFCFFSLLLALLAVSACSVQRVSQEEEQESAISTTLWLERHYGFVSTPELRGLLARVSSRLADAVPRASAEVGVPREDIKKNSSLVWRVYVLDTDEVNAFLVGGGNIFLTKGIFDAISTEAELAAILSHEMGHQVLDHPSKYLAEMKGQREHPDFAFSLEEEQSADIFGLQLLKVARYDLRKATEALAFAYTGQESGHSSMGEMPYFSENGIKVSQTPPWLSARLAALQRQVATSKHSFNHTENSREFNQVRKLLGMK